MSADILDWTNAGLGDLDTAAYRARAAEMADRLKTEVGAGRLPFLGLGYWPKLDKDLGAMAGWLTGFEHMLLLGIGGSALGARALQKAFFPAQDQPGHNGPWLWIADNVDARSIEACMAKLPPEKTVVVVVSKSGGTIETVGQYFIVRNWLKARLGASWKDHALFVTDQKIGFLRREAASLGIRTLAVPDNLGGRYSVLSAVGLAPALFMGLDPARLVKGAAEVAGPLASAGLDAEALSGHPAFGLAIWAAALMDRGFDELIFFSYLPLWACFGDWFAQLWAESLGKQGKGSQPIPAVGVTDQHSVNQMFLDGRRNKACLFLTCPSLPAGPRFPEDLADEFAYVRGRDLGDLLQAEALGTRMALTTSGVPLVEVRLDRDGQEAAGKLMALLGAATILTGWLMDINPLDQPAVELGKRLAKARMGAAGLEREKADLEAFLSAQRQEQGF
ncbi:MAG: glucose-6-phosphate isomerase [Desulfovibrionaceae bacterium]|nr:glucose-6-phosphate isomerase [Desulfovibrionaceae bacterium]